MDLGRVMQATDWPRFELFPKWLPGLILAGLFALGALGALLTDMVVQRTRGR